MSFFVSTTESGDQLTTAGYVAAAVILIALIVLATVLAKKEKKEKKKMGTKQLVFCAMGVALAMVTSMLKVYSFPFGGSITSVSYTHLWKWRCCLRRKCNRDSKRDRL